MNGLWLLGLAAVPIFGLVISLCKTAARADQQDEATAERLALQNRDWNFPRPAEEER